MAASPVRDLQEARSRLEREGRGIEGYMEHLEGRSPFRAGGRGGPDAYTEIPAGPITIADIANLYLYPNFCCALRVTGAQLVDWLEQSAGAFQQIIQGEHDQPLLDPTYPSYNFDVLYGLTYEIDLAQPARFSVDGRLVRPESHRVHDLRLEGKPVDPAQDVIVACSDYRASGAGRFAGAQGPGRTSAADGCVLSCDAGKNNQRIGSDE